MRKVLLACALLGVTTSLVAAPTSKPLPASAPKPVLGQIKAGELRLDGKVGALLGDGQWQLNATSWTSPRGVKTHFDDVKAKIVQLSAGAFIHPLGSSAKMALTDVTIKASIAVIGKNGADGVVQVREVILLGEYDTSVDVGDAYINEETGRLIDISRRAHEAGQLNKALELAKQAAEAAAADDDTAGEALCLQDAAILYSALKQPEEAIKAFKRVHALGEKLHDPMFQVLGLEGQGAEFHSLGQNERAISLYNQAIPLSSTTEIALQINVLDNLADVYESTKNWTEAVNVWLRLFPLEEKAARYNDATKTLLWIARYQAPTDLSSAKKHLEIARKRMEFFSDEVNRRLYVFRFANALKAVGYLQEAKEQYGVAAKLAEAKGDTKTAQRMEQLADAIKGNSPQVVPELADDAL